MDHQSLAKSLFNETWDYLENDARTPDENRKMLAAALGSWHHW